MALTTITKDFIVKSGLRVEGSNSVTTSTAGIGTLSVNGGAAVAGNIIVGSTATLYGATSIQNILNVAGDVTVNSGKAVIASASGNIYTQGDVGVQGAFNSTGTISINNLFSVDGTTGNLATEGTLYAKGNAGVGGAFNSTGTLSVNNLFSVNGTTGNLVSKGTGYFAGAVGVQGAFNSTGTFSVNSDKFTVDAASGNLVSKGTGYFAGAVGVQGAFNSTGTFSVNSDKFTVDAASGNLVSKGTGYFAGAVGVNGNVTSTGTIVTVNSNDVTSALTTSTAAVSIQAGGLYVSKSTWIDSSAAASAGQNGALVVATGGAYVGNNIYVAGTDTDKVNTNSNSIFTMGGVGIAKDLNVGGDVNITGNLRVSGTQTIVNSTQTAILSPVIDLGTLPDNSPLTGPDNLNKGLVIHYWDTQDNHMFLGRNDTSGHLILRNNIDPEFNGAIPNSDYATQGAYATMDLGTLIVNDTTTSTDYQSGALQVAGGVGIGGDIYLNTGKLYGTATQANNLNGGAQYQVPYQTASGLTSFVAAPTSDQQVLTYTTVDGLIWASANATTVGRATTATNIDGGAQYDISFQSDTGLTTFDTGVFQYNNSTHELKVNTATLSGGPNVTLSNNDGGGTELYSTAYAQLNYDGTNYIYVNNNGAYLETLNGDYSLNLDTSGNLTLNGGGTFQANYVNPTNLTSGSVTYYNGTSLVDDSGLTYNGSGTLTVGTALNVGTGTGGNITMTGGDLLGVNNIDMSSYNGTLTVGAGGVVKLNYATNSKLTYVNGSGNLVTDANLSYDGTTLTLGNTTDTTNNEDGALVVAGGVYIAKRTYIGGGELADGTGNGALAVYGGIDVNNNVFIDGGVATNGGAETKPDLGTAGGAYIGKDLYVGTTATINGDLFVDGTIFVKGSELTGLDQISGSTATFADLSVTNTATIKDLTVTGQFNVNGYSLGSFANIYSTATAYLNNVSITGTTTATNLQLTSTLDNGYGFNNAGTTSSQAWSVATAGGIFAFKNITAGGVVSAGDVSTLTGNDTGSVDAFYAVNNIQAARTIRNISGSARKEIDRWDKTNFTSAKYLVQIVDSGDIYVSEFMIVTDGTAYNYISEYGNISNNGDLGVFTVTDSGNNLVFSFTPAGATSMTIQVVRQSILTALESFC